MMGHFLPEPRKELDVRQEARYSCRMKDYKDERVSVAIKI